MAMNSIGGRLGRLEELKGLLRARDFWRASELAGELGVGVRTIFRDIGVLRELGLAIDADRGRGGGIRLDTQSPQSRFSLGWLEAIDLLLALSIAEKLGSPLLFTRLPAIKRKISAVLSGTHARRLRSLRKRIFIGQPASPEVMKNYRAPKTPGLSALAQGFFEQRVIAIGYNDAKGNQSRRDIEAQVLYFNMPVWYVLGWDLPRLAARTFRIDRVTSVELRSTAFRLRDPKSFVEQAERDVQQL
jgi:predicted DNA-binding transcriptional regulator YafY